MRTILITGVNSYIGNAVGHYLENYNAGEGRELYRVDKVSLRDANWKGMDFAPYDTVFHVAGIAHADIGKVPEETKALYYRVNCGLAEEVAGKARQDGVKQFIYMSSVIVYGDSAQVGKQKHITAGTPPSPANFYGDSKFQAESKLLRLQTSGFRTAIVRAPMIYGKGSKGNFPMLLKLAGKMPVFPRIDNRRSMLYVENLAEFIRLLAEAGTGGIFFPQNREYVATAEMVRLLGEALGRRVRLWKALNPLVMLAAKVPGKTGGMVQKAFGSLTVEQGLSNEGITGYQLYSLEESIRRIVG